MNWRKILNIAVIVMWGFVLLQSVYKLGVTNTRLKLLESSLPDETVNKCYDAIKGK